MRSSAKSVKEKYQKPLVIIRNPLKLKVAVATTSNIFKLMEKPLRATLPAMETVGLQK
ncbi:hypothetical protein YC2023_053826 [Brassica napus]